MDYKGEKIFEFAIVESLVDMDILYNSVNNIILIELKIKIFLIWKNKEFKYGQFLCNFLLLFNNCSVK